MDKNLQSLVAHANIGATTNVQYGKIRAVTRQCSLPELSFAS